MTEDIAISEFVRRQTPESRFAHFDGTEDELITLIKLNWHHLRDSGAGIAVRVPSKGFWSSTVTVGEGTDLHVDFSPRRDGEESHLGIAANGEKVPARLVDIILYHKDVLAQDGEELTGAEWEVISINAYPDDQIPPMHPITMARNFLHKEGGTKVDYTPEEFANAIWYWSQHTNVCPPKAGEYRIVYCALCRTIAIVCPHCHNTSCNGGGCDECHDAFENRDEYLKCGEFPDKIPVIGQALHKLLDGGGAKSD
jgi:hypothetical protein